MPLVARQTAPASEDMETAECTSTLMNIEMCSISQPKD